MKKKRFAQINDIDDEASEDISSKTQVKVTVKFSPLSWPLFGDGLVIGRKNPLGKNAAAKIAELFAPEEYVSIVIEDHPYIEALLINKKSVLFMNVEEISDLILEEISDFSPEHYCLKVEFTTSLLTHK